MTDTKKHAAGRRANVCANIIFLSTFELWESVIQPRCVLSACALKTMHLNI